MTNPNWWIPYAVGVPVVLILALFLSPFTIVNASERAVVLRLGKIDRVLEPGIHWLTPLVEGIETLDVTTQKAETDATAASKDLQTVHAKIAVNYNLVPEKVDKIWQNYKGEHVSVIVTPAVSESVKAATAKYTAEELITKREHVKTDILESLKTRLAVSDIVVTNVSITDFDFSAEFNKSIEAKVKAEQDALTSKNKLEQVKYEAEQRITQAKAEAEAIRIQANAINSQGGEDYVNLKAIEKWNGELPRQFVPGSAIPFLKLE